MKDRTVTRLASLPKLATFKAATKAVLRVAAYARVSTAQEEQQSSMEAQIDYYTKKIAGNPGWQFVKVYVDNGISGLRTKLREGFNQMVEDCLAGHIDLVLTKSISRFARNTLDTITTVRKLKEKNIAVYFEKENIYSTDAKGEFLLTLMSSLAQEESRSISENVTWSCRKRMADGKVSLAYSNFLGYDRGIEKFTMVVNEGQAVTVRLIFRLFLQGYTPHGIASVLTERGINTPAGKDKWNAQTIRRMLRNEKYKGDALLQKEFTVDFLQKKKKKNEGELPQYYVEGDHEAIISPWLFDYVQERNKARERSNNRRYSGHKLLSSKVVCGECGSAYSPRPWHSTSYNHLVWQCRCRIVKGEKCPAYNVYDKLLHFAIHDMAMQELCRRNIQRIVAKIILPLVPDVRKKDIRKWLRNFKLRDIWLLQSDEDDLALVIEQILVYADGRAEMHWLDGEVREYQLPRFRAAQYKVEKKLRQNAGYIHSK